MSHALALLLVTAANPAPRSQAISTAIDSAKPIVMAPNDNSPVPGESLTYTVTLSGPAALDGVMLVSSSTSNNFLSLPTIVVFNAGDTSISFNATLAGNASGALQVNALLLSGSVSSSTMVKAGGL